MIQIKQLLKEALSEYFGESPNLVSNSIYDTIKNKILLSKKEVSFLYGVSINTISEWERKKLLPKRIKKGSRVFYNKQEVLNQLNEQKNG